MEIYCDKPVVIRHPHLAYLLFKYSCYHNLTGYHYMSDSDISMYRSDKTELARKFNPYRMGVTPDNIEQFYLFSPESGETEPMYILVPCGKCPLCLDKKKKEWSFRAFCENAESETIPLFVTCTYKPKYRPKRGVNKRDVQLFLKRLRIRLDRLGIERNFRYFAVGEYGHNSKLPHYHLILWNFATPELGNLHKALTLIESAWSTQMYTKYGDALYNKDGSPLTESLGFCYVKPVTSGAIGYVMKYMHKMSDVPQGQHPVFFLSSRKDGGLGAAYGRKMQIFYRNNPETVMMSVYDPYSCKNVTAFMPTYFKNMFFPSVSKIIDSRIHETYKRYISVNNDICALRTSLGLEPDFDPVVLDIQYKYRYFPERLDRCYLFPDTDTLSLVVKDAPEQVRFGKLYQLEHDKTFLEKILSDYDFDNVLLENALKAKKIRQDFLTCAFNGKTMPNLNAVKERIIYAQNLAYTREII